MEEWVEKLEIDMIPAAYQDFAELIGVKALYKLAQAFGGSTIYIPKADSILRPARDQQIKQEFNGYNHADLAEKYNLTEKWIREICGPGHHKDQMSIFDFIDNPNNPEKITEVLPRYRPE
ncbi:Mor transcription activator family protein [Paenibacillus sanguinis]|uniref:Mor transcription activator family protein n=1 Tax=Paenibacillus sanguinis TaxID=225906 RepID=UPI0003608178|nr:Mor transcription activator family protein [Paenibacillus sanguinis]